MLIERYLKITEIAKKHHKKEMKQHQVTLYQLSFTSKLHTLLL